MKFDRRRRRFFLTGAGALVALPFLPSLLPRAARAESSRPVRYVQVLNPYGATTTQFYGRLSPAETVAPDVRVRRLSDVEGDISELVGPLFTPLKSKISLLHGLDVINENPNHQMCFATCASGYAAGLDGDGNPPLSGQPSVDVLIANSSAVYDETTPQARRLLMMNPVSTDDYTRNGSFSWRKNAAGAVEMIRPTKTTMGLTDILASGFGDTIAMGAGEELLLQSVHDDYRRVRDGSRISASDRERLEAYMTLVQDIARGRGSCAPAELDEETSIDVTITNQFRLLTAAMMCDLTRVASITLGMSEGYSVRHTDHHDLLARDDYAGVGLFRDYVTTGRRVGELLSMFESTPDGEGTLLDNAMVYWGMQYGNCVPGDQHRPTNMPVLVAGTAGGRLQAGHYIDYRKERPSPGGLDDREARGIPINNLLVTFMHCMGLTPEEYESAPGSGYGYYNSSFFESAIRPSTDWRSAEARRTSLPFFSVG